MPTFDIDDSFWIDYKKLSREEKRAFGGARREFIEDIRRDGRFRGSLRVKPLQGHPGIWEMSWEGEDGRATFDYGPEQIPGKKHIRWRRIGSHKILDNP